MITIEQTITSCYDCTSRTYRGCECMPSVNKNLRRRLNPSDGNIPVWCPRRKKTPKDRLEEINRTLLGMRESIPGAEFFTEAVPKDIQVAILNLETERIELMLSLKMATEAEIKAAAAKMDVPSYLMTYHNIRWALIDYDLNRQRF